MDKYVIVGVDAMFNDLCDVIHLLGGQVVDVYQNFPENPDAIGPSISERIQLLGYSCKLHENLNNFQVNPNYFYIQGLSSVKKYKMIEQLKAEHKIRFTSLVHPQAYIGSNVVIGEGVFINALTAVAPNTRLADFCSINRSSVIGHDVFIGKYTRLGPNVSLAGSTKIGSYCSICIAATVIDYVEVGDWSVVGAGSVVTKNIAAGKVAVGVPARVINSNNLMPAAA